jgi:hypothetical protein
MKMEKQKEERNPNRFLERNNDDGRQRALISLLFSSLPPLSPLCSWVTAKGWVAAQVGGDGIRVRKKWRVTVVPVL